jgi:hypothetical protein
LTDELVHVTSSSETDGVTVNGSFETVFFSWKTFLKRFLSVLVVDGLDGLRITDRTYYPIAARDQDPASMRDVKRFFFTAKLSSRQQIPYPSSLKDDCKIFFYTSALSDNLRGSLS